MPKSEKQKLKTLYVAEYFLKNTDENHPTTIKDIIDYLETEHDILAERRSVLRDILILRDDFGMDIECPTQGGSYYRLLSRDFELDDLKLLAECVHATKFISKSKAKELVEKIGSLGSNFAAEQLQEEVFLCDRVKTNRRGILSNIANINYAMSRRWDAQPRTPSKISFQYMKYQISDVHSQVERRKGAAYIVSPFKLLVIQQYIENYCLRNGIGKTERIFNLTERAISKQLALVCDYLGFEGIGTHSFRKWYATEIYKNNGYDITLVQRLLQHSSAAITQRYIGIEPQRIEEAIEGHAQLL